MTRPDSYSTSLDIRTWAQPTWARPQAKKSLTLHQGLAFGGTAIAALAAILLAGRHDSTPGKRVSPKPAAPAMAASGIETRPLALNGIANLDPPLRFAGFAPTDAAAIAAAAQSRIPGASGEMRGLLRFERGAGGIKLLRLQLSLIDGSLVVVERTATGYSARNAAPTPIKVFYRKGTINTISINSSAVKAGIPDSLVSEFAGAFAFNFDLQFDINPNDTFEAAFEQRTDMQGIGFGPVHLVYAALRTAGKPPLALYRFAPPGEKDGWFDGNGVSSTRSLMRTPVDGAQITSRFGYRIHPISGFRKMHEGTDFAAPTGTAVYAAGDGVIDQLVPKNPSAGNFLRILHTTGWRTRYLHLDHFAPGLALGDSVHQGQLIGAVGTTGHSTGPHLHYEVYINNVAVDPQTIETGSGKRLEGPALARFFLARDRIDAARQR